MPGLLDPTDTPDPTDPAAIDPTAGLGPQAMPPPEEGAASPDFITRLGRALGGGPAGIAALSPEQQSDTGRRALLNFGLSLMQGAGPSYVKKSVGQILAGGLGAAEDTETGAETTAAQQHQVSAEYGLQAQDRAIKLAQFRYQMQILQRQAAVTDSLIKGLTGQPGAPPATGGAAPPGAPAGGGGSLLRGAALPPPDKGANIASWQDPGAAALVIAEAKNQGVDPNLALAVAHQESQGNPNIAAGDGGRSHGLFQIGTEEAAGAGVDADQLDTLPGNVRAGVGHLKNLIGKYGDVNTALVAYNAGEGRLAQIQAGKAEVPATTRQYLANVHSIVAGNPTGQGPAATVTPTAAVSPTPAAVALPTGGAGTGGGAPPSPVAGPPDGAPGAAGGPGYVPSSGARTTILPGASPGTGSTAPGTPAAGLQSLPFGQRQLFAAQLASAAGKPEETAKVMADINAAITNWSQRAQKEIIPQAEARTLFGQAFDPTAIYTRNRTDGSIEVVQQGQHPVNLADTPEAKAQQVALTMAQKRLETMATTAEGANKVRNQVETLQGLNSQIGSADVLAKEYPNMLTTMQTLNVGTPEERQRWSAQQAFQAIGAQLAVNMRDAGTGRLSNQELDQFKQALPNIGQDPQARLLIMGMLKSMSDRQIAENTYANNYFMKNHSLADLDANMEKDLGPVIQRAPGYDQTPAAHAQFQSTLRPGQPYYKPNGQLAVKPMPGG